MPINQAALERFKGAKLRPEKLVEIMEAICSARDASAASNAVSSLNLDYQDQYDEVQPGEMIPFITIGLRQATVEQSNDLL